MKASTKHMYYIIALVIVMFITLGGLGNAAMVSKFYWLPFILNIGVYSFAIWKLYKEMKALEKEGK